MLATVSSIWSSVPRSRMLCFEANSWTYLSKCFGEILWNTPLCARLSVAQKLSMPLVCAFWRTYSPTECRTASLSLVSPEYARASSV